MSIVLQFIRNHSTEDLLILGFFIAVGATVAGWIIDFTVRERGFGVIGNSLLIVFGAVVGAVVAQMNGPIPTIPETQRIVIFSATSAALALLLLCTVKSRTSVV